MAGESRNAAKANSGDVKASVDRIEKAIRQRFPEVERIYVEAESIGAPGRDLRNSNYKIAGERR